MENPHDEELIAYLDGELDPTSSQQVEDRLKQDPKYRRALTLYERSWDMLDRLERSTVGDSFTRSTMEMISLAAADEKRPASVWIRSGLKGFGILALLAVVGLALGYGGGRAIWPDPNRELLEDLPVLEDLPLYEQAGSVEFLRKLSRERLFSDGVDNAKLTPGLAVPDALPERQKEIERMGPAEREHLARKLDRFDAYSPHEQQRMRNLHESLNHDGDGTILRDVLVRYHEWLALQPGVREELGELSDDERITRIKQLRQEQAAHHRDQWKDGHDLSVVVAWLDEFAWQHRQPLLGMLSDQRRKYLKNLDEKQERQALMWMMHHRVAGQNRSAGVRLAAADYDRLAEQLSPEGRERLEAAQETTDKSKLIHQWVQIAQRQQADTVGLSRMLPPIKASELERFRAEELTDAQRKALPLDRLPRFRELLGLYFLSVERLTKTTAQEITDGFPLHSGPPRHPHGGPGPDGPPPGGPSGGGPDR
jgi:hypothetical protein